jgi:hypothetical protein
LDDERTTERSGLSQATTPSSAGALALESPPLACCLFGGLGIARRKKGTDFRGGEKKIKKKCFGGKLSW